MREQFHVWLKSLVRYGNDPNNYIEWKIDQLKENINEDGDSEYLGLVILYTRTHSYSIKARVQNGQPSYLGCIASVRKPLAGETHTRGNDLADGYFNQDTWNRILSDILSYELVKIVKSARRKS
jgi:hypothetical protein